MNFTNFPADKSHFDFYPSPINQSIFPGQTSVQPELNPNPINQPIFLADVSNDNSIGTPSNNLLLCESTNVLENGPKKKLAKHKSRNQKGMAKSTLFCHHVKNHTANGVLATFSVMTGP